MVGSNYFPRICLETIGKKRISIELYQFCRERDMFAYDSTTTCFIEKLAVQPYFQINVSLISSSLSYQSPWSDGEVLVLRRMGMELPI
jgi:hypothetical protein